MDKNELYRETPIENDISNDERVVVERSPLTLDISEIDAVNTIAQWEKDSHAFFKDKYNLYERRKKNEIILFGRQIEEKEKQKLLKIYESRYLDNVIYEIESALKPLAMSRLPDMVVYPDSDESEKEAEILTKVLDTNLKKRENREILGMAFKHHPVYFVGIIKVVYDPEINDYKFIVVHPDLIEVDYTCKTKNADDMVWISETISVVVQELILNFPDKKDKLINQLKLDGIDVGSDTEPKTKGLLTAVNIKQVWYDWYEKTDENYAKISCVMWKYKDVVLMNIKNPNFDYEGVKKMYMTTPEGKEVEVDQQTLMQMIITGQQPSGIKEEIEYKNYFEKPRKPYYFIGYDQWGKIPYDETSRIEQNIRNQEILDRTGKSVIDKLSQRVKHIFSKDAGLKKEDLENMDSGDPMQDMLLEGNVHDVHDVILPEQVTPAEFQELDKTRQRMYQLSGANAIRGEVMSDTATSSQIAREADYTRADDLVEDTINSAHEWMSQWAMHLIKLRYTEDHFKRIAGENIAIVGDMIKKGMDVHIKSSATDKLKTRQQAIELASQKMIDPVTLFRDMGLDDPEGRTEDLMLFQTDPASYLAKIKGLGSTTPELVSSLMGSSQRPLIQNNGASQPSSLSTTVTQVQDTGKSPLPIDTTAPPSGSPRAL